jgi:hypothetical protein
MFLTMQGQLGICDYIFPDYFLEYQWTVTFFCL